jgi:hypothetical protein
MPLFKSPVGFLRARANFVFSTYADTKIPSEALATITESVLNCLADPSLPVQVEASKALKSLLESCPSMHGLLEPCLPQLLTSIFAIMNNIGNDEVVTCLDILIETFHE